MCDEREYRSRVCEAEPCVGDYVESRPCDCVPLVPEGTVDVDVFHLSFCRTFWLKSVMHTSVACTSMHLTQKNHDVINNLAYMLLFDSPCCSGLLDGGRRRQRQRHRSGPVRLSELLPVRVQHDDPGVRRLPAVVQPV